MMLLVTTSFGPLLISRLVCCSKGLAVLFHGLPLLFHLMMIKEERELDADIEDKDEEGEEDWGGLC